MTDMDYRSREERKYEAFLKMLRGCDASRDGIQLVRSVYPLGCSPCDAQDLALVAEIPMESARKVMREFSGND